MKRATGLVNRPVRTRRLLSLLHGRKRGRPQESAFYVGNQRPVPFAIVARFVSGRIGLKGIPFFLAIGNRIPRQQVMQIVIAVAD